MATSIKRASSNSVGITPVAIGAYTAPSVTTGVTVFGLTVANTLGGPTVLISAYVFDGSNIFYLVRNAVVMQGGAITICDEGSRQALNANDQVFVFSSTAASVDVNMSVAEIT